MKYELRIHMKNGCYNYTRCEKENYASELESFKKTLDENPDIYYAGVTTVELYSFNELNDDSKETAIEDIKHNHLGYYEDSNCNKTLHCDENVLDYIHGNYNELFFTEDGFYVEE